MDIFSFCLRLDANVFARESRTLEGHIAVIQQIGFDKKNDFVASPRRTQSLPNLNLTLTDWGF